MTISTEDRLKLKTLVGVTDLLYRAKNKGNPEVLPIPDEEDAGICHNVAEMYGKVRMKTKGEGWGVYYTITPLIGSWKHPDRRKCNAFPISFGEGKWEGEQLSLRTSLLEHMACELREQTNHLGELREEVLALAGCRRLLNRVLCGQGMILEPRFGICRQLQNQIDPGGTGLYILVAELARKWPLSQYPGEYVSYPVPMNYDFKHWEGPNLKMRLSLLQYMIKRLRDKQRRAYGQ